jgi:hypothetical protein
MQTLVQVVCQRGRSLRDSIVNDDKIAQFGLAVHKKLQPVGNVVGRRFIAPCLTGAAR